MQLDLSIMACPVGLCHLLCHIISVICFMLEDAVSFYRDICWSIGSLNLCGYPIRAITSNKRVITESDFSKLKAISSCPLKPKYVSMVCMVYILFPNSAKGYISICQILFLWVPFALLPWSLAVRRTSRTFPYNFLVLLPSDKKLFLQTIAVLCFLWNAEASRIFPIN